MDVEELYRLSRVRDELRGAEGSRGFQMVLEELGNALREVEEELEESNSILRFGRIKGLLLTRKILRRIIERLRTAYVLGERAEEEMMKRDAAFRKSKIEFVGSGN